MGIFTRRAKPAPARARSARTNANLTAAAVRLDRGDNDVLRRLQQGWQSRAFVYYDTIPEIWYASQFYGRWLSMLEIYVGKVDRDTGEIERVDDDDVQGYVERIQDPGGGRSNLLGQYGRLMFVTGETFLCVTEDFETGEEKWEFLSTDELRPQGDGSFTRYRAPSLNAQEIRMVPDGEWIPLGDECVAYRFWRKHPRYSALADAPMRGVLDLCEELLILTQAVRARALSRLAAGVLVIPDQVSFPNDQAEGEEDPEEDEFMAELLEHFEAPVANPGSASAAVPFILRVDGQWADKVKLVDMQDPTKFYPETGLRVECIHRIAMGLDLPPEILLGTADANHWTAWNIDEQTWKAHLQPIAQTLVDDLTAAYLKPAMRQDGYADWADYVVAYDAKAIINHPDRAKDAKDLHAALAISDEALREATGFDETAAITDPAELNRRLGTSLRDSSVAIFGVPTIKTGGLEPAAGEIVQGGGGQQALPPGGGASEPQARPGETGGTGAPQDAQPAPRTAAIVVSPEELRVAVRLSVTRCRELAGSRIVSRAQHVDEARALIRDVPKHMVASALGESRTRSLVPGKTTRALVAGGTETLASTLIDWGVEVDVVSRTCQAIERHAARTLYTAQPGIPPELET
jgi:hypothetical protein